MALILGSSQLLLSLGLLLISNLALAAAQPIFDIVSLGAQPDHDSTPALQTAWADACDSTVPATIFVPYGRFLIKIGNFSGPCKNNNITVLINGTLVAMPDTTSNRFNSGYWLVFSNVDGLSIIGGLLDGQGTDLWECKNSPRNSTCPDGDTTLELLNSQNVVINGLSSLNPQLYHIVMHGCTNVTIHGVYISADGDSINTDGIHVAGSSYVSIVNASISTGDDCISIASGASNLWIENIACGPGHGISIGSLAKGPLEDGVENVTVTTAIFTATQNGVRIKSWGRPSNASVTNVVFQHITFNNVSNPVVIDQNYCPLHGGCPKMASGVKISNVTYQDIRGTSASEVAMKFDCSPTYPCTGIKLEDINLTYDNETPQIVCNNAQGTASGRVEPSSCLS